MNKTCSCEVNISTGPDPVYDAEQDPFCLAHPAPIEVLLAWVIDHRIDLRPDEMERFAVLAPGWHAFLNAGENASTG